jgi:hypothetical protein
MRKIFLLLMAFIAIIGLQGAFAQGSTTSSLSGVVKDASGEAVPGATIIAVHTPTGSQFGNASGANGNFIIRNMNVGGPYKITVSFVGFQDQVKDGVYLNLGQTLNLSFQMSEEATELSEVVITGSRAGELIDGERTGAETNVSEEMLGALPNASRSLNDFTRLTPQASFSGDGLSIAGTNNRYNAIFIDGAVNNDVFGLAGNGQNGGQIGISPISVDAISQIQVLVAPYDVTKGGFAGGGINAVTRSGSNKLEGSVYHMIRNEGMSGKTPTAVSEDNRTKLADFSANITGFRLGGALKKDKLFFFVNGEIENRETPRPFDFNNYTGDLTRSDVESFVSKLNSYGYDPGAYEDVVSKVEGTKFLVKLDWNINKTHKFTIRHSYTQGESTSPSNSSTRNIRFANSGILFPSVTNSTAVELKSNFGNNSNNLIIGYTRVRDNRDPMGDAFPFIDIGFGDITAGSEQFSTGNILDQDIFTITDNFVMFKGKHTWTFGTHNEFYNMRNVFVRQNFGAYRWNTVADFVNGENPTQFDRSFSLVGGGLGDDTNAAAEFKAMQLGFYAQDEIQVSDKFKLTAGVRVDIPIFTTTPTVNDHFNDETIPLIKAAGYDMQGAETGKAPKTALMFAPRVGFNYDLKGDQSTQIRGGLGIFTSRVPFVWPGGMYNNNGVFVGGTRLFDDLTFEPDPNKQPPFDIDPNNIDPSGQIDLFTEDFKYPQVLRTSLAVDQKLPWGLVGTAEVIFTKTLNNVFYENLNLKKSVENFEGADNRPIFDRRDEVDDTYTRIILGSNTNEGYTMNATLQVQKPFSNGLTASLAYNYGEAEAIFEGTSSQNSSQWRGVFSTQGRNNAIIGRSQFAQGGRLSGFLSYKKEYLGFAATTVTFFLNAQSGSVFSYVYDQDISNGDSRSGYSLIYIPRTSSDIVLVDNDDATAAQQWTALDNYIKNDDYLNSNRGGYADKNASRLPFETILDFKIQQDFFLETGNGMKHSFQVGFDIFNFTNFLNKDWGVRRQSNFGAIRLLDYEGTQDGTNIPTFTFDTGQKEVKDFLTIDDSGLISSRWQMQLSLRYSF